MMPEWLTDFSGGILRTITSISFFDIIDIITAVSANLKKKTMHFYILKIYIWKCN